MHAKLYPNHGARAIRAQVLPTPQASLLKQAIVFAAMHRAIPPQAATRLIQALGLVGA